MSFDLSHSMESVTCWQCGVLFAMPWRKHERAKVWSEHFWCPNGHELHYQGQTREQLESLLQTARDERDLARTEKWNLRDQLRRLRKKMKKEKADGPR